MMTSSISSSSSASSGSSYTARQQRIVDALRVLMGAFVALPGDFARGRPQEHASAFLMVSVRVVGSVS